MADISLQYYDEVKSRLEAAGYETYVPTLPSLGNSPKLSRTYFQMILFVFEYCLSKEELYQVSLEILETV